MEGRKEEWTKERKNGRKEGVEKSGDRAFEQQKKKQEPKKQKPSEEEEEEDKEEEDNRRGFSLRLVLQESDGFPGKSDETS